MPMKPPNQAGLHIPEFLLYERITPYIEAIVVKPELIKWVNSHEVLFSCDDLCEKAASRGL